MIVTVKAKRREKNYTQEKLAKKVGVGRSTISEIEAGKHVPSVDVALRIANALDCKVEELFRLKEVHHEGVDHKNRN